MNTYTDREQIVEKELFIVPANWWRKWCDFVNVEYATYSKLTDQILKPKHKRSIEILKGEEGRNNYVNVHESLGDSMFITNHYGETPEEISDGNEENYSLKSVELRKSVETDEDDAMKTKSDIDEQVYSKPGKIINKYLLRIYHSMETGEETVALRPNLQEVG